MAPSGWTHSARKPIRGIIKKTSGRSKPAPSRHWATKQQTMDKYLDRLKAKGSNAEQEKQFAQTNAKAALQWEATLLETRSKLEQAKDDLETAKSASPLSAQRISELMDDVEAYEKGLGRLTSLKAELFG